MMEKYLVDLEPIGRRIEVEQGMSLLEAAQRAGVDLVSACGGMGVCGSCVVQLVNGKLSPLSLTEQEQLTEEQISQGYRLACVAKPLGHVKLNIPPESMPGRQRLQLEGEESFFSLDPAVTAVDLKLDPPRIEDLRSDLERLNQSLAAAGYASPLQADLSTLAELSQKLRSNHWWVRLAVRKEAFEGFGGTLVGTFPAKTPLLGLAVDMGSTKLAFFLVDLKDGATLANAGVMNPQIAYGEDVVSRIAFANRSEGNRRLLQTRLVETFNQTIAALCEKAEVKREQIVDVVVVGNTAMHHFFCGLPVAQLGAAPYIPAASAPLDFRAAEIGLAVGYGAWVHIPANIAGYVGADHTAALLASQAYLLNNHSATNVLVDIGTNTEISLIHQGTIHSCSTASGPAFEGAHIRDGMRAAPGAIERVRIDDELVRVSTIDGLPPVGICGTGILKALSEMLENGILDWRGALRKDKKGVRLVEGRGEFILVPSDQTGHGREIVITRKDVNEIQLAKSAIRSGIEILLEMAGIRMEAVDTWIIAGAFGTYLDLKSAVQIGIFPAAPLERFRQVGNAAGVGAKQMLLSLQKRREALVLATRVNYVELTIYPDFTNRFTGEMYFSRYQ